jgi:hypothetical protein
MLPKIIFIFRQVEYLLNFFQTVQQLLNKQSSMKTMYYKLIISKFNEDITLTVFSI